MQIQDTQWQRAKDIFESSRLLSPDARRRHLDGACRGDDQLRRRVEELIAAQDEAGSFLESPTMDEGDGTERHDPGEAFRTLQHVVAGRFSLDRELGRGGMGIVFLARDVALDRPVAIKVLPPPLAAVHEHRERFLREARTVAGLSHPNIVAVHGVEEHGDLVFFIMALVDGESLADRVRRAGCLKPADAARMVQEVAWALGYAHGRGVIHRDIKPDNILIERNSGRAMVSDFGIARVATAATMSQQGEVMGTLRYMSPEQASGERELDGRSDLYSLGVTAYYALTGQLPFESPNPAALLAMHLAHPAPPVRSQNPAIPARLAEAVDRCLAKDPAARFATGEALADALTDARVLRTEIAPSIREFLASSRTAAIAALGLGAVWFALIEVAARVAPRPDIMGHPLDPAFAILSGITVLVFATPLLAARGVLRAGLDERDVARAVMSNAMARDANVEYQLRRAERVAHLLEHPLSRALFGAMAAFLGYWIWTKGAEPSFEHGAVGRGLAMIGNIVVNSGFLIALATVPTKVVALVTRGTAEHAGALRRFWEGIVGRTIFRIAGVGLGAKRVGVPAAGSAPTEVLLGRAAGAIFEQLPEDQRKRLGDVHAVIGGLERAAAALRVRRDQVTAAAADLGASESRAEGQISSRRARLAADLEAVREPLEGRLQTAVGALENLRLDLLRLRAGVGHPDDLTASIEEAEGVRRAVEQELGALREVNALQRSWSSEAG